MSSIPYVNSHLGAWHPRICIAWRCTGSVHPLAASEPWFAGGTVESVQAPGIMVTRSRHIQEQFEVGMLYPLSSLTYLCVAGQDNQLPIILSSLLLYLISSL